MPPIFVDARELAGRLDVSYDTVLTWVRRGKIPHVRDGRGRLLFNLNTVLETLRQKPEVAPHEAADWEGGQWHQPAAASPSWTILAPSDWPMPSSRPRLRATGRNVAP